MPEDSPKFNIVKLLIVNNELDMSEELNILELLNQKYQFRNLAAYSKENDMTPQGILKRKKTGKQPYVIFGNQSFYF